MPAVLAGGTDGYILARDDIETTGLKWIDPGTLTGVTVANQANDRIITATAVADALNAEANLTYNTTQGLLIGAGNGIVFTAAATTYQIYTPASAFKASIDIVTGTNSAAGAGDITLKAGAGVSAGGNVYFQRDTTYGNFYLGTGGTGHLPAVGSETDVVFYDPSTGKLSYGTGGNLSWGTATNQYLVFGSASGDIQSSSQFYVDTTAQTLYLTADNAAGNTILDVLKLTTTTSTTAATGLGVAVNFGLENLAGAIEDVGRIAFKWTDITASDEEVYMEFSTMDGGSLSNSMTLRRNGILNLGVGTASNMYIGGQGSNPAIYVFTGSSSGGPDIFGLSGGIRANTTNTTTAPYYFSSSLGAISGTYSSPFFYMSRTGADLGYDVAGIMVDLYDSMSFVAGGLTNQTIRYRRGATDRISMFPHVADGASAIGYMFDTENTLSTAGSKLLELRNAGTSKFYVDYAGNAYSDGTLLTGAGTGYTFGGGVTESGGAVSLGGTSTQDMVITYDASAYDFRLEDSSSNDYRFVMGQTGFYMGVEVGASVWGKVGISTGDPYVTMSYQNAHVSVGGAVELGYSTTRYIKIDATASYWIGLGDDDTEDHVIAIDDATGLLTKRAVSTLAGTSVDFGTATYIPYMQTDGLNFDYSSSLKWDGSAFTVTGSVNVYSGTKRITLAPGTTWGGVYYWDGVSDYDDIRIGSNVADNGLFYDASNKRFGIETDSPAYDLEVNGSFGCGISATIDGTLYVKSSIGAASAFVSSYSATTDAAIFYRQVTTTKAVTGWDHSALAFVSAIGTSLASTARTAQTATGFTIFGSTTSSLAIDAASSTANIYLTAASTADSTIRFRNDTTTRFFMGYDYSVSRFQIHSSTAFSTSADFQIDLNGHIGLGAAPNTNDKLYIYDSNASGTHYALKLYSDGNIVGAHGIYIQAGLDTLTTSDNTYLWCVDGDGTTVGTLLADTTSFRLYNAVSSRNYKANIRELTESSMAKFRDVRSQPKRYNYIGRSQREKDEIAARGGDPAELVGFVIEDLEINFPEAIRHRVDENGVDVPMYADTALIPYIVKSLVEVDAVQESQESRIASLEARVLELENS
ncbi:MAG: hypothetical protein DRI97_01250 [Bacteroidetes bacterium]|nr:MAG: hypothetical protein DRI97_01250 [Bacteroidota bacterium]